MVSARSVIKYVSGFFFVIFLSLSILLFSVYQFTSYDNIKPIAVQTIANVLSTEIDENQTAMFLSAAQLKCQGEDSITLDLAETNITLECEGIVKGDRETLKGEVMGQFFENVYNSKYECKGVECFAKHPMFFISSSANDLFFNYFVFMGMFSLILCLVLILAAPGWASKSNSLGFSFILVGVQFVVIYAMKFSFQKNVWVGSLIMDNLLGFIFMDFLVFFILGCVVLSLGLWLGKTKSADVANPPQ